MFVSPARLRELGILGMNSRNVEYIARYNDRRKYPLVDDKLLTKKIAIENNIKVPKLFGSIEFNADISKFRELVKGYDGFVVKPAQGSGGRGILVIVGREDDCFVKPNGDKVALLDVERHVSNILSGLYSLGGRNDVAMIENLIAFDNVFDRFSFEGVPDVRVIVYRGYPALAMMRLSTSNSDGKANLHQGAVGAGIDILTGKAISAVQFNRTIERHPDTDALLSELKVPHWDEILHLSAACYDMTGLGYLGTDVVLDKNEGPMILELNARPGLAIQIANRMGSKIRFDRIDEICGKHQNAKERVAAVKELFAE